MTRRALIAALVGLNLLLMVALVLSAVGPPAAYAQIDAGRPGDFIAVTSEISGRDADALFLLDVAKRELHVFIPEGPQTRRLEYAGYRDLYDDFPGR